MGDAEATAAGGGTRRVFVNYIDTPVGAAIAELLARSAVGATAAEEEDEEEDEENAPPKETYTIVGTLKNPDAFKDTPVPKHISDIVKYDQKEDLTSVLLGCDDIVYNIAEGPESLIDEASWAATMLHDEDEHVEGKKNFVCVTSVMTWAKTKPADPDEPEATCTEDDYRRRRPHMSFKPHINAEKLIIKCGKKVKHLKTYVVAAGMLYGRQEFVFHQLFKSAWELSPPELLLFGDGQNALPAIHVQDLCSVVLNVLDGGAETRYILAVDDALHTLEEITKCISENLGSGKVKQVSKEDALLLSGISQADFDQLTANIRLESGAVKDMNIEWVSQEGIVENIETLVQDFKDSRNLQPLKICVLGPPASGKTTLATELCSHYKLHHVHTKGVIDEALAKLKAQAELLDLPEGERPEETEDAEQAKEELEALQGQVEDNGGRYDEEQVIKWFRQKLYSQECKNQGYVLDGFPKTEAQAQELFQPEEEDDENPDAPDPLTVPEFVFALGCTDEFLKERIMELPEDQVSGTHNAEDAFLRRLAQYRQDNTDENTVLNYFDFREIHPDTIELTAETLGLARERVQEVVGVPHNYGPTPEEQVVLDRLAAEAEAERAARQAAEDEQNRHISEQQAAEQQAAWDTKYAEVRRQEQEALDEAALPLRNYLMKHVMPTLSQGLVEVSKSRPDDPIDFLAEFLFKNNPQIE